MLSKFITGFGVVMMTSAPALAQDMNGRPTDPATGQVVDRETGRATDAAGNPVDRPDQFGVPDPADIIVTARRQAESLRDVPISIIAVDQRTLTERNVTNANDLVVVAPGLSIQNTSAGRGNTTFSIRGQGQTFGQNSPGVVAYFADVPEFGSVFFDLENVQVLKGPQGTLFGRNTTGGAILFVPRKPTNDADGYVQFRAGQYNRADAEFAMGGAIIPDKVMVRASGQLLNRKGYTRNLFDGRRLDNEQRQSFRVSLVIKPLDILENYTIFQYQNIQENGSGASIGGITATNPVFSAGPNPILPRVQAALAAQLARGPRVVDVNYPNANTLKSRGIINTTRLDLTKNISLKNIFSYRWSGNSAVTDLDGTRLTILDNANPFPNGWVKSRTEELQLQANFDFLNATIGYFEEQQTSPSGTIGFTGFQYISFPPIPGLLPGGYIGPINATNTSGGTKNGSDAFYGEANIKPIDGLTLTAGIRRSKLDRFNRTLGTTIGIPGLPFLIPAAGPSQTDVSFKATTWNLAALYQISPDFNIYGSVRRGFKSGGVNGTALNVADQQFRPEQVTDYEIGVKTRFDIGGWSLRANAAGFYDDYTDIQRFVNLNTVPASTVTRNAAAGTIKGIDLDLQLNAPSLFSLGVTYTYLDAKYDEYTDSVLGDLSNNRFPNTPKHQLNIAPRFILPLDENVGRVSAVANIYYQSLIATDPINRFNGNPITALSVPGSIAPSYTRIDLRLEWAGIRGKDTSLALFARNVTNKTYIVGSQNQLPTQFGLVTYLYGEPRQIGAELRIGF
jgi:iron complex outermembrane receptor protein